MGLGQLSALRPGDIVLSVNGKQVLDDEDASKMIRIATDEVVLGVSCLPFPSRNQLPTGRA